MKQVCVKCACFFRMIKAGYYFIEGMPAVDRAPRGTVHPELWKPYKVWVGDQWECPECHTQILSGFGQGPIAEHYQDDFTEKVRQHGADQLQVNDC